MSQEATFTFVQTVSHSFVLNGKRYTRKYETLPPGTYQLVPVRKREKSA